VARVTAITVLALVLACAAAGAAQAMGKSRVAALQVALGARGHYAGTVDGIWGRMTERGVRRFQRSRGLRVDGIAGPQTRRALGRLGRPRLGRRLLRDGRVGFDVAQLQFLVAWHGFPSGSFDGGFGPRTERALRHFQRWARLGVDGVAGPATFSALRRPLPRSPLRLAWPVRAGVGDRFGPRGNRFHAGLDFPARHGARVRAARSGRVAFAGWDSGGYGYIVSVRHGHRVRTRYAHLSTIGVRRGQRVRTGSVLGRVGSTGASTGPHLHFEVLVRGAAADPLPALR
jgi:peptidoglycan hydrolase-like protein with peptidoglycan-binding domain